MLVFSAFNHRVDSCEEVLNYFHFDAMHLVVVYKHSGGLYYICHARLYLAVSLMV